MDDSASDDLFYDAEGNIFEQFSAAMVALQLQDAQGSEQAMIKAKLSLNSIVKVDDPEEFSLLKIMVGFIEVTSRFLKGNIYLLDERYKKSMDEFVMAKQISDKAKVDLSDLSGEAIEVFDETGTVSTLHFMLVFFDHMVTVMCGIVQKAIDNVKDEVEAYRSAASAIMKFNYQNIDTSKIGPLVAGSIGMLGRIADRYEKKAERVEEKRKVIQFMPAIDNKVFIVHGHDEGILRELKELLDKNFKVNPIILRDEIDIGKTLIEKFEHYGRLTAFTFVIVTPDDLVKNKKMKSFQARPNVLFELGWFCGRLGRPNVRIIRKKDTPLPSDLNGIVTLDFNERVEELYLKIKTDLETANLLRHMA